VADRLFVDLAADGQVSVSTCLDGEPPGEACAPCSLTWPLDAVALEELRWYLEDYLRVPPGVSQDRGPQVAVRLEPWGEAVFGAVFGAGPARDAYLRMRARGTGLQVVFRSDSARLLALPWELMRDPERAAPLTFDVAGTDRSLPGTDLGPLLEVTGSRLRVLMVTSGPPAGPGDGYRITARLLPERLAAIRGPVDLVVLRPPALDTLAATLAEAAAGGEPFHLVHFDGYGLLPGSQPSGASGPGTEPDAALEETLGFPAPDGGPDLVPASRVAQVLAAANVPVAVLSACQSGAVGQELAAAVATRLLRAGIASVVAMPYHLQEVAAAEYLTVLYERLFAGDTVALAAAAGRRRLFSRPERPGPQGERPLPDWLAPVHYLSRNVRFPALVTTRPAGIPWLEENLDRLRAPRFGSPLRPLAPAGTFTGRDGLFYALETAARRQRVIILNGPAGTGKTELAKAFGRWWRDTGGAERPEWVFWHDFAPGLAAAGLDGVTDEIGFVVRGPDFAKLDQATRSETVEKFLRDHRALLIWDNFESVRSVPDPPAAIPPLGESECQRLRGFLRRLAAGGRSAVFITSHSAEAWLDDGAAPAAGAEPGPDSLCRITVPGLLPEQAAEYAGYLLALYPAARRTGPAFGELLRWLNGHPLNMRLVLPHLATTDPEALLDGLRGSGPVPGGDGTEAGRTTQLTASLGYSFGRLDPAAQRLLVAVSLLQGTAQTVVLGPFAVADGVPPRFQDVDLETWTSVLDAADRAGLLAKLGSDLYWVHPAVHAYLTAQWRREDPGGYPDQRAAATRALLIAYASYCDWWRRQTGSGEGGDFRDTVIGLHQRTLGGLLGFALDGKHWKEAQAVAQELSRYWDARGAYAEASAWTNRGRTALQDARGTAPALDSPAGRLWLFLAAAQAARQVSSGQPGDAESGYRDIVGMLQAQPASAVRQGQLAATYQQLGAVIEHSRPDEAADWYAKARVITEELGDRRGAAASYHQLGAAAEREGRLEEAADWYGKARVITEELGDRRGAAATYHKLGIVALLRGRLEEAADWYTQARAADEEVGDRPSAALACQGLGTIALRRQQLDEAEDWYAKALAIREELGDRAGLALLYQQLGALARDRWRLYQATEWYTRLLTITGELGDRPGRASACDQLGQVAHRRGRLAEADDWYQRSLDLTGELGDRPAMARTYARRGLLAAAHGNPGQALDWAVRCVALFDDVPHPDCGSGPGQLARLSRASGTEMLEACWQRVTGGPLPGPVRDYVRSPHPEAGGKSGQEEEARGGAAEVADFLRDLGEANPAAYLSVLAPVLGSLSSTWRESGQWPEEARQAAEDSCRLYRDLAAASPAAYLPGLAAALLNLSACWRQAGRGEEARQAAEESAGLYRTLAESDPAAYRPALAGALLDLSACWHETGRGEEARQAAEESAGLYRTLAGTDPAYLPRLALALSNLADVELGAGRWEEARRAAEESASVYRPLAAAGPAEHLPGLAQSLSGVAYALLQTGRREEARPAAEESAGLYRQLAEASPAYLPGLAPALNNLSNIWRMTGRGEQAVRVGQECVGVYRQLAETDPAVYLPGLATALDNLSGVGQQAGQWEEARRASEESAGLYRQLAEADPAAYRPGLALSLNNLANALVGVAAWPEAGRAAGESAGVYRELAEADPAACRPGLALSLNNLASALLGDGRPAEARPAAGESAGLYRQLAEADPAAYRPGLALSLGNLASALLGDGRLRRPGRAAGESAGVYRELAEADPAAYRPGLALSLNNLANALVGAEAWLEAGRAAGESAGVYRELAEADPAAYRPGLALSLYNLANALLGAEAWLEAGRAAGESAGVYRTLAEADPAAFLPGLATALDAWSIAQYETGRPQDALLSSQEAVDIYRRLAQSNLDLFLPALADALGNFATVADGLRSPADIDALYDSLGAALGAEAEAVLLLKRDERRPDRGIEPRFADLARALALAGDASAETQQRFQRAANQLRDAAPGTFDRLWRARLGELPEWLAGGERKDGEPPPATD
jgi:hypothetical protein